MKNLEAGFAEVEKRVQALIADNEALRRRLAKLEQDLAQAKSNSEELENFHGKRLHIREKIEKALQSLESLGVKEP